MCRLIAATTVCLLLAAGSVGVNGAFDMSTAIRGVKYSKVSYCSVSNLPDWQCYACPLFPGMQNVSSSIDEFHDSQAWIGYNSDENEIVLGFRGTVNLQGWVVDADFFQINYTSFHADCQGCLVHEGLYWGYKRVADQLFPALKVLSAAHPNATIFVTGHSMGAAMAGFAIPDVVREVPGHQGKKIMYNYGSPRLGNPAFVRWMEDTILPQHEHFRSTNFGDPIPHLAPIVFDDLGLGNWLHSPREVFFKNPFQPPRTDYKICNGTVTHEDPTCADSTPVWDMLSFINHTTYLNMGLGCFIAPSDYSSTTSS